MGLIDLLLNRKNITFNWTRDPGLGLIVDLDRHALCDVAVGEHLEGLRGLGPADDRRQNGWVLRWDKLGLYLVRDEQDRLNDFVIFAGNPFRGRWRWHGQFIDINAKTSPDELRVILGEPFCEYHDTNTGEIVWFYESPQAEWQFTWNAAGNLDAVEISNDHELTDEPSRKSYGCTREWPFGETR